LVRAPLNRAECEAPAASAITLNSLPALLKLLRQFRAATCPDDRESFSRKLQQNVRYLTFCVLKSALTNCSRLGAFAMERPWWVNGASTLLSVIQSVAIIGSFYIAYRDARHLLAADMACDTFSSL
jgi:hypothetical protein